MKKYLLTLLAVLSVLTFIYSDFIVGGMERTSPDYIKQGMPINQFVNDEKNGLFDFPLWYNDIFGGMPFHASGTYHIKLNIEGFVRMIVPESIFKAVDGRFTLHLLLGFIFMVVLLRYSFKVNYLPAVTAGFAYILTSHILGTEHVNRISTFIYIPLVFLGAKEIFGKNKTLGFLLLSLGLGFQLNSYHQQITYYTMLFVGFYFLWKVITQYKDEKIFNKKSAGIYVGALAVAMLIGLVAIWPMHDYLPFSARGAGMSGAQKYQWMTNWGFSPKGIFDFIFPHFEGFAARTPVDVNGTTQFLNTYWGTMPFTDYPHYLGIVVVFLAGFGLFGFKKSREIQFLVISSVIFLFLSFGRDLPVLYNLFYNIVPYFDKFRAPALLLIILEFNVAVLAGIGLNNIITKFDELKVFKLSKKILIGVAIFYVATLLLSSPLKGLMFDWYNASGKGQSQLNVFRFDMLQLDFLRLLIVVGFLHLAIWFGKIKSETLKLIVPLFITTVLVFDLVLIGTDLVHGQYKKGYSDSYYKNPKIKTKVVDFLLQDKSIYRIMPLDERFQGNRFGFWRIQTIGGYHAAKTAYIQKMIDTKALFNRGVMNMLDIKYILARQDIRTNAQFSGVELVNKYGVFKNNSNLGRVFFASKYDVVKSDDNALKILLNPRFNAQNDLFMQGKVLGKLDKLSKNATAKITKYRSNEISMDVDAKTNTILVLSEIYYPMGWKVYVDGVEKNINRTNYLLRSVFIEKGKHKVDFKFTPASFRISIVISLTLVILISIVFVVFMGLRLKKKKEISEV